MKILVVDDSLTMRRIVVNALDQDGTHELLEASDGMEALQVLDGHKDVGLVLCDWNMPNMDGLAFLQRVRELSKELPILMVTTENEKKKVVRAIRAGADGYIIKPFTPEVLQEKIAPFIY